jgi:serine/threonine protein kinase
MNKTYTDFDFPLVRALPWQRVFRSHTPPEAADLVAACLRYDPTQRVTAADALAHPFFDELRSPGTRLPNGAPLPPLFDLSDEERGYLPLALQQRILPAPSVLHSPSFLGGKVVAPSTKV